MDLNELVADGLGEGEHSSVFLLSELKARLVQVGLDVIELRVVLVLVLDLLLECLIQLLDTLFNLGGVGREASLP